MAVRKTKKGLALKRWFKEKWVDEKGNPCGSAKNRKTKKCRPSKKVSKDTPVTWKELTPAQRRKAIADKKKTGMGKRAKAIRRK